MRRSTLGGDSGRQRVPPGRHGRCLISVALDRTGYVGPLGGYRDSFWVDTSDLLATVDVDGRMLAVNPSLNRSLGPGVNAVIGAPLVNLVHPDDRRRLAGGLAESGAAAGGLARWNFGGQPTADISWTTTPDVASRTSLFLGRVMPAVRDAINEGFRVAFNDASIGMALVTASGSRVGIIEHANDALATMTGRSVGDLEGMAFDALVSPLDLDLALEDRLASGEIDAYEIEKRINHLDGYLTWGLVSVSTPHIASDGTALQVFQLQDISDRKRFRDNLEFQAEHDPLTGLFNRRRFATEVQRQIVYARRYGGIGAVLFIDLDNFKDVNDTLGHRSGDDVIISVADLLQTHSRATDVVARLGGDEFAILLPESTVDDARVHAEAIRRHLHDHVHCLDDHQVHTTASIGVAGFTATSELSAEDVLMDADLAMYEAKESGRDHTAVCDASSGRHSKMEARRAWSERIAEALREDLFVLHAHPILDLATGQTDEYELLLRMQAADGGLIYPEAFLHTAERSGMAREIDEWVTRRAIDILDALPAASTVRLSVNISAASLADPRLAEFIRGMLADSDVDPRRIVFEITETAAVSSLQQARPFVVSLRELGCGVALDDFGAGFSSFSYLKHLPIDRLKIDGEYIRNIGTSVTDRAVVEAIVKLARCFGKQVVAEWVADADTMQTVADLKVDFTQGYFTGRPVPVDAVPALAPEAG